MPGIDERIFKAAWTVFVFALLLAGIALRLLGTWWFYASFDAISLVPCTAGMVLLVGGMPVWRWAWPAVLFLGFMIPLPFRVASALSAPLQTLATITSTFVMQTLGLPALADGVGPELLELPDELRVEGLERSLGPELQLAVENTGRQAAVVQGLIDVLNGIVHRVDDIEHAEQVLVPGSA